MANNATVRTLPIGDCQSTHAFFTHGELDDFLVFGQIRPYFGDFRGWLYHLDEDGGSRLSLTLGYSENEIQNYMDEGLG